MIKSVEGYEGVYEASSDGFIYSAEGKETYTKHHGKRVWKRRKLSSRPTKEGYSRCSLWLNGSSKDFLVHRVIAETFIPNPENLPIVNHIDGDKSNNSVSNLEWCSPKGNVNHAFDSGLMPNSVEIILKGEEDLKFRSMAEASRFLGKSKTFISSRLKSNNTHYNGYEIVVSRRNYGEN